MSKDVVRPDYAYYLQRENKDNDKLSRAELETTLSALIVAGGETTAAFLSGIVFYMVQHPEALHKLEKEVRERFESESDITAAAVWELPYFNACVKEGLRLCPAVPFGHPRMVPKGGDEVLGQWLPGGVCDSQSPRRLEHC
jgi:cytochrome P450